MIQKCKRRPCQNDNQDQKYDQRKAFTHFVTFKVTDNNVEGKKLVLSNNEQEGLLLKKLVESRF